MTGKLITALLLVLATSTLSCKDDTPDVPDVPGVSAPESQAFPYIAGTWEEAGAKIEIEQKGRNLFVYMHDTIYSGSFISKNKIKVNLFNSACCEGYVVGGNTINWENGFVWKKKKW